MPRVNMDALVPVKTAHPTTTPISLTMFHWNFWLFGWMEAESMILPV